MFKSALIAVLGVGFCVCMPPLSKPTPVSEKSTKTVSTSDEWKKSIFDHMAQNKEVCPDLNTYIQSEYAKDCKGKTFPTSTTNSIEESENFLCVGFYDRVLRMCYAGSRLKVNSVTTTPKTTKEFDAKVKEIYKTNDEKYVIEFCQSWETHYPARIVAFQKWITLLNGALSNLINCIKICSDEQGNLRPVCAVLNTMDSITEKILKEAEEYVQVTTKKIIQKTETPAVEEHKKVSEENPKEIPQTPVLETVKEKPKEESAAQPQTSSKNEDNKKIVNDAPKNPPENLPQQQEPQNPAPPVGKDAEAPPQSLPEETAKTEKAKKLKEKEAAVESEPVAKKQQVDDSATDKKTEDQPSAPEILNGNDGEASHEVGGEDGILENGDVISQHTQDQENPDAGEEINEMHPPQGPLSEDAEESPPMPSDKREYIPRLPGTRNDDDSHFFGYFTVIGVICIAGYVGYHNKQKILAMLVEGRRSRGGRGRRRPSTANYRKLDCTLEEAVTSQCNSNVTHVIY